ncbi:hypothetical protein DFJ73DRAFT_758133 [Zopfochytrium polystomum]|nr:hypothetical protein DFJ73DRAFT_758133 [Zopfochytrium polystomum]
MSASANTTLVISDVLPQTRYDVCWLEPLSGGQQWTKLTGCALILYTYSLSQRKSLWTVLLLHAVGGLLGTLIENAWVAAANCGLVSPGPGGAGSRASWVLLANEANWTMHEAAVVAYSFVKTRVVVTGGRARAVLTAGMAGLLAFYVVARFNVGRVRAARNALADAEVAAAHGYVYAVWLVADAVLMGLLAWNVAAHVRAGRGRGRGRGRRGGVGPGLAAAEEEGDDDGAEEEKSRVVRTLLSSSLPRFAVIFCNTAAIAVLDFAVRRLNDGGAAGGGDELLVLENFQKFTSMVKGAYPTLLLLDILMTRFLLYAKESAGESSGGDGKTEDDGDNRGDGI